MRAGHWRYLLLALLLLTGAVQADGRPVIGLQLEPPVLDPTSNPASPINEVVYANVLQGLVWLDAKGRPQPWLATQWQVSADGLSYRFSLRDDVRFHDGVRLDAEAVRANLQRARAPDSLNPQRAALQAIDEVLVLAEYQLEIRLLHPFSGLLQVLGMPALTMLSPAGFDSASAHPQGTGPFRFASWRRGDRIDLDRNPDYWGRPAQLAGVGFRFISDPSAAYAALMAGDIQAFPNYPAPENVAQFEAAPGFQLDIGSTSGKALLALNHQRAPLQHQDVRVALTQALDRAAIIDGAMYGYGEPIGSHATPNDRAYVDLSAQHRHDPTALAPYLDAFERPLVLALPPAPYARRAGEIIVAQLQAAAVPVRVENLEWAQWLSTVFASRDYDLTIVVHVEPLDYDIYARDDYYFGYQSAVYRQLLAELDSSLSETERDGLLVRLQQHLADEAVNVWLFAYPRLTIWDAGLQGVRSGWGMLGTFDVAEAWMPDGAVSSSDTGRLAELLGWLLGAGLLVLVVLAGWRLGPIALLRQLLVMLLTLLVASLAVFWLMQLVPGDPARYILGLQADDQSLAVLRGQLGLDDNLLQRYLSWLAGLWQGDFGLSYTYRVPVAQLIAERLPVSVPLALYALLLSILIALPLGLVSALRQGRATDLAVSAVTQLGVALPGFWIGMLLVLVFALQLGWFSAGGFPGWSAGLGPALKALTLPALALALPQAAVLSRVLRGALIEAAQEDFMRTALAKGSSRTTAFVRHALPNALIPVLTILGMQFGFLLAGSVIIENVFFLPGLGRLVFQAISQRDLMVVQGVVMLLVAMVVLASFAVELLGTLVDPRQQHRRRT